MTNCSGLAREPGTASRYRLVGNSPAMQELRRTIEKIAPFPRPVLIRGARGSGKEAVACLLHQLSPRKDKPFVVFNAAGLASGLMASEIFGHEKGAFTSATERRPGKLEQADSGTLFLDEIGNMPLDLQKLLLRVIEYQRFERVGGSGTVEVDARIIAATNADLEELIAAGAFSADLYDRIRYAEVRVPALYERREDIPDLAGHFLTQIRAEMPWLSAHRLADETLLDLAYRPWPGNVRELRATVEAAAVMADGAAVESRHLPPLRGESPAATETDFVARVAAFEKQLLHDALRTAPHGKAAAAALGLGYDQFRRLQKKHQL